MTCSPIEAGQEYTEITDSADSDISIEDITGYEISKHSESLQLSTVIETVYDNSPNKSINKNKKKKKSVWPLQLRIGGVSGDRKSRLWCHSIKLNKQSYWAKALKFSPPEPTFTTKKPPLKNQETPLRKNPR